MSQATAQRVYLVRHGAVSYFDESGKPLDPRQVPLNCEGIEQVQATARLLVGAPIDCVVCSGLPRTLETAGILLQGRTLELQQDPDLKEIRAGRLRDIPPADRQQRIAHAYSQAALIGARFMGGEHWGDFQQRVLGAFERWISEAAGKDVLLVVHDAVIRVILSHVCGSGLAGLRAFEQDPAALSILDSQNMPDGTSRYFLRAVNVTAYDHVRIAHRDTVMSRVWRDYRSDD